jgi:carbonic anhydrase
VSHGDRYLASNALHAAQVQARPHHLPVVPSQHVAVVACMDSRLDVFDALGLRRGEAHVIRNAGGVVSEDVIRSLAVSQQFLQTTEILLIHHTDCGLQRTDEEMRERLRGAGGEAWPGSLYTFADPFEDVRRSARTLRESPFVPHTTDVRGFVYDVDTGLLHEVEL